MEAINQKYSCESASETLEWMNAIVDFLRPYKTLIDAHVVNFFKDRLWEIVDEDWMECLRKESVDNLLGIPCGFVQDITLLECVDHYSKVSKFPVADPRVQATLARAGFLHISRLAYIRLDHALITSLVERWRPETCTFHMRVGEMTITLQDVVVLLGLRVDGPAVTGSTAHDWPAFCQMLLGVVPDKFKGGAVTLNWLRTSFPLLAEDATQVQVERYTRAYILQLIGGCLFPDRSRNIVHMKWLPLLGDLDACGTLSWGSAVLAYLYDELSTLALKERKMMGGCLTLLQEYWPSSLQEFVLKSRSLALPRQRKSFHAMLPNLRMASLGTVLSQGMNSKKKHEVEVLAAVVNAVACGVDAHTIVDVGSGQGYLAQALSFEYQLSVVAIDASLHHSTVTAARAERIKKHYAAKLQNLRLKVPRVVTCCVLSSDMLTTLSTSPYKDDSGQGYSLGNSISERKGSSCESSCEVSSLVLAGLHACGDLSVSMLRTFAECEQVKALVVVGCCYNLLSEEVCENGYDPCSFPMSSAAKLSSLNLVKNARDLACQSAERWGNLTEDAALQNFELHAFRAAFQMVLDKHFPGVLISSPSIGRQGKALRRQQLRKSIESQFGDGEKYIPPSNSNDNHMIKVNLPTTNSSKSEHTSGHDSDAGLLSPRDDKRTASLELKFHCDMTCKEVQSFKKSDECILFKKFSERGLSRLNLGYLSDTDIIDIWREAQPFSELVGPFWSLRAALGQLVETYILLDRLLFLQERGSLIEACIFPIFDPTISPRNVAIIARKGGLGA